MNIHDYVVQIRKGTKRITLQRFFCSKIAYGKDFSEVELAALFHNQLWLQTKSSTDPHFREKFGKELDSLTKILKKVNFGRGLTEGAVSSMKLQLKDQLGDFLFPQRNLPQIEAKLRNAVYTKWRTPQGVEVKRLPPEKHIGKGYRDHGTAKRPEFDASPPWQEVASVSAQLERQLNELREREKEACGNTPEGPLRTLKQILFWKQNQGEYERLVNQGNSLVTKKSQASERKLKGS